MKHQFPFKKAFHQIRLADEGDIYAHCPKMEGKISKALAIKVASLAKPFYYKHKATLYKTLFMLQSLTDFGRCPE